jgi:hypothetical protein
MKRASRSIICSRHLRAAVFGTPAALARLLGCHVPTWMAVTRLARVGAVVGVRSQAAPGVSVSA